MNTSYSDKRKAARKHALAVLKDQGKIVKESDGERIPSKVMVNLLGLTFTNGKPITKGSEEKALIHWHETGFLCYAPALKKPSKKQLAASDKALMASAIAETMKVRKTYRGKEKEWK